MKRALLWLCFCAGLANAAASVPEASEPEVPGGRLALMPLQNFTGSMKAMRAVAPCLAENLEKRGFSILPEAELRGLVRTHRIRCVGRIGRAGAEVLSREAGVDYIALGSINIFDESSIPEVSVTLRLLNARTLKIAWAGGVAESGLDRMGPFGLGKILDAEALARGAVGRLLKTMPACLPGHCVAGTSGITVAIIPLDNFSNDVNAGDIVTDLLLARLYDLNLDVVEPGMVEESLAELKVTPRGEIDAQTTHEIRRALGANVIVTGAVDEFQPGRGDERTADPSVDLTLKFLSAGRSTISGLESRRATGQEREFVFGIGREYSLGQLAIRQMEKLLDAPAFEKLIHPEVK